MCALYGGEPVITHRRRIKVAGYWLRIALISYGPNVEDGVLVYVENKEKVKKMTKKKKRGKGC